MIVRVNIGLGNANKFDFDCHTVARILDLATRDCASLIDYREVESAGGDWEPEKVLWAELEIITCDEVSAFKDALESLCVVLNEDAIAVAIVSPRIADGTVIFNPNYTGEKYDFNLDYFTE